MAIHTGSGTVTTWAGLSSAMNSFATGMTTYSTVFTNGASGTPGFGVTSGDTHSLCLHHIKSQMNYIWTAGSTAESDTNPANAANRNWTFLNALPWADRIGGVLQYAEDESYMRGYMMTDPDPRANHVSGVGNNSPQASVPFGQHEVVAGYQSSTSTALGGLLGAGPFYKKLGTQGPSPTTQNDETYTDLNASQRVCDVKQMPGCEGIKFADNVNYNFYGGDGLGGSSDYFHMVLEIRTGIFSHWWSGQIDPIVNSAIVPGTDDRFGGFMGCSGPFVTTQHIADSGSTISPNNGAEPHSKNPMNAGTNGGGNNTYSSVSTPASILHVPEGPSPVNWEGERGDATRGPDPSTGIELTEGQAIDFGGAVLSTNFSNDHNMTGGKGGCFDKLTSNAVTSHHYTRAVGVGGNTSTFIVDRLVPRGNETISNVYFGANWANSGVAIGWGGIGFSNTTPTYGMEYLTSGVDTLSGRTFLGSNLCIISNTTGSAVFSTQLGVRSRGPRCTLLGSYPGVNPISIQNFLAREILTIGTDLYDTYPQIKKGTNVDDRVYAITNSTTNNDPETQDRVGFGASSTRQASSGFMGYAYEK